MSIASRATMPEAEPRRRIAMRRVALTFAALGVAHFAVSILHWIQIIACPWSLSALSDWITWEAIFIPAGIALGLLAAFAVSFVRAWRGSDSGPSALLASLCFAAAVFVFDVVHDRAHVKLYILSSGDADDRRDVEDFHYYATWWWLNDANGRPRIRPRLGPPW